MFTLAELPPLPMLYLEVSRQMPDAEQSPPGALEQDQVPPTPEPRPAQPADREPPTEPRPRLKRLPNRFFNPEPIFPPLKVMLADVGVTIIIYRC